MNEIQNIRKRLTARLSDYYPQAEAESLSRLLLEKACGIPYPTLVVGDYKVNEKIPLIERWMDRLLSHEPLQYVLGQTDFAGYELSTPRGVLIPRPETEELCHLLLQRGYLYPGAVAADLCTGSGAIAVFLAKHGASVDAVEYSEIAIEVASENFARLGVTVNLQQSDLLSRSHQPLREAYDLVVSNPPYIMESERVDMLPHVLDYEPEMALFVPDDDPLIFYRHIKASYHSKVMAFEINPLCIAQLRVLFSDRSLEFINDFRGNTRFLIVK